MKILSLGIADDHTHPVATLHPKGSQNFRKRYAHDEFWTRNGTFRSIGDVDKNTVMEYSERHNQSRLVDFVYRRKSAGLLPADA